MLLYVIDIDGFEMKAEKKKRIKSDVRRERKKMGKTGKIYMEVGGVVHDGGGEANPAQPAARRVAREKDRRDGEESQKCHTINVVWGAHSTQNISQHSSLLLQWLKSRSAVEAKREKKQPIFLLRKKSQFILVKKIKCGKEL